MKPQKKRYEVVTLGCRTNQYESQAYRNQLESLGWIRAKEGESADICIVNTCTVTATSDQKSRAQIKALHKRNQQAKIFVTGCLAEREPEALSALPGVAGVIPNGEKEQLIEAVFPDLDHYPEFQICQFAAHTRAFVKVQDGCNSFCSYCVIPYVRGRSRSRSIAEILSEVKGLIENGYREVVLTGINIGDYEWEGKGLAHLVTAVDQVEGLERLRLSSIDPDEVDDALMDAIGSGKNTCPSMHIVLQSGSDVILKRMRRKYTMEDFFQSLAKLRSIDPKFTFTTDVIVGFSGEGESEFQETLRVIEEVEFAKVHVFPFSVRPQTRAARYKEFVPPQEIAERSARARELAETVAFRLRDRFVGDKTSVLLEQPEEGGQVSGHCPYFLKVLTKGRTNEIVHTQLLENTKEGLIGGTL